MARKDAQPLIEQVKNRQSDIRDGLPEVTKHFAALLQAAKRDGVLSQKIKELIALAIAVAIRCDYCIAMHVANCLKAGATREEILEVCGVAIAMGGGPSYTYTAMVLDAIDACQAQG